MKLKELQVGDEFTFVKPLNKNRVAWVVEGQYPKKRITTVYSKKYAHDGNEPIAVKDSHEVKLFQKGAYSISHKVSKKTEVKATKQQEQYLLIKVDSHKVVEKRGPDTKANLQALLSKRHKNLKGYTGVYDITRYATRNKKVEYYLLPAKQYDDVFLDGHFLVEHLNKEDI